MKVLVACEFSGIVRDAFLAKGHDAISCDLLPTEQDGPHYQGDVLDILGQSWDLLIAHPPCTYLSNSGVRHLYDHVTSKNGIKAKISGEARWQAMFGAVRFFNYFLNADHIPKRCIENPVPHGHAKKGIGDYTQLVQPWHFGEKQSKAVCLWLRGLPKLTPTNIVGPPPKIMTPEEKREWHKVHFASPGKDRWKVRSRFFPGIAQAMADQFTR